jgi:hypothetical protein
MNEIKLTKYKELTYIFNLIKQLWALKYLANTSPRFDGGINQENVA